MDGYSSCAPRNVGPRVQFSGACEQSHWWPSQRIQQEAICYHWFKQRLILSVSEVWTQYYNGHRLKRTSVPAREYNLKAYAAITWHNDPASLGLEPRLADHRSQAARTATLPIAPPGQATHVSLVQGYGGCGPKTYKLWLHYDHILLNIRIIYKMKINESRPVRVSLTQCQNSR